MKYNVFTDFHHASLLNSLIMLFEKRLGGKVYRPIGKEWFEQGFWKVFDHPATVEQYLGIGGATPDGTPELNQVDATKNHPAFFTNGIWFCNDIDSGLVNKAITFDAFMVMPIDIVIASLPQHIEPFKKLCEEHPNHPKLIYQIGNAWNVPEGSIVKNVMASAVVSNIPDGVNFVSYHQEFDLEVFKPTLPITHGYPLKNIYSFVNCFGLDGLFKYDWELFTGIEKMLPDYRFKSYGGQCRDGACHGTQQLADKMRETMFIWHTKVGGDGYGHVLHNTAAVAKPTIVKREYYSGKLGEKLLIDGKTCIAIDGLTPHEIVEKINYYSEPTRYQEMCQNVFENFKKEVDFEREAEEIKWFLDRLQ